MARSRWRYRKPRIKHSRWAWKMEHRRKRAYATKAQAQLIVYKMWWINRKIELNLQPYKCNWARTYERGRTGEPHWHIGHRRKQRYRGKLSFYWNKAVWWPLLRIRRKRKS